MHKVRRTSGKFFDTSPSNGSSFLVLLGSTESGLHNFKAIIVNKKAPKPNAKPYTPVRIVFFDGKYSHDT